MRSLGLSYVSTLRFSVPGFLVKDKEKELRSDPGHGRLTSHAPPTGRALTRCQRRLPGPAQQPQAGDSPLCRAGGEGDPQLPPLLQATATIPPRYTQ